MPVTHVVRCLSHSFFGFTNIPGDTVTFATELATILNNGTTEFSVTQSSTNGATCASLQAALASNLDSVYDATKVNVCVLSIGINDLGNGDSAATVAASMQSLINAIKALHASNKWVIMLHTLTATKITSGNYQAYDDLNALIPSLTSVDYFIDFSVRGIMSSRVKSADRRWYLDDGGGLGLHPAPEGKKSLAQDTVIQGFAQMTGLPHKTFFQYYDNPYSDAMFAPINLTIGQPDSYAWTIGGSTVSTSANPSLTRTQGEAITLTLTSTKSGVAATPYADDTTIGGIAGDASVPQGSSKTYTVADFSSTLFYRGADSVSTATIGKLTGIVNASGASLGDFDIWARKSSYWRTDGVYAPPAGCTINSDDEVDLDAGRSSAYIWGLPNVVETDESIEFDGITEENITCYFEVSPSTAGGQLTISNYPNFGIVSMGGVNVYNHPTLPTKFAITDKILLKLVLCTDQATYPGGHAIEYYLNEVLMHTFQPGSLSVAEGLFINYFVSSNTNAMTIKRPRFTTNDVTKRLNYERTVSVIAASSYSYFQFI
jgi:lysophospholipase L1-like esterase